MKPFFSQMLKFYLVGASGVVVNLGILYILTEYFNVWYFYSAVAGVIVSVTTNFIGNKFFTFRNKTLNPRTVLRQYINFWIVSLLGIFLQLSGLYILVQYLRIWYMLSALTAIAIASFLNFILNKYWTFRERYLPLGD